MIIGIVAISQNYAIGRDGKLPWHYSADLKFFKRTTVGNAVVMGSSTWRELGKPLPSRLNILLSRNPKFESADGAVHLRSREDVLAIANYLRCDTFVLGGAKTFEAFTPEIEKWIVTEIPLDVPDADTFMPRNFLDGFAVSNEEAIGDGLTARTFLRK
jgi:dihydrofolate reductase